MIAKQCKRIFALVLVVVMAATCLACGPKTPTSDEVIDFGSSPNPGSTNPGSPDQTMPTPNGDTQSPDEHDNKPTGTPFVGETKATPKPKLSYDQYRELNDDVIGWIKIDHTKRCV